MAKTEPRKPLRERVAERKAKEAAKAEKADGGPVDMADPVAREKAEKRQRWEAIGMVGTVLQWCALIAVIVQGYLVWQAPSTDQPRWQWMIVFAVFFVLGRAIRMVGIAQVKSIR